LAAGTTAAEQPRDLYATVEREGRPVPGLQQQNFRLYLDKQPQPFHLEPPGKPANVVFVIENSDTAYWYRAEIEAAMREFMDRAPEDNWYALVSFAREVNVEADFTHIKERIASAYDSLGQSGRSDISTFDAAYSVISDLRRIPGRNVIVFIGSGLDRYSEHSLGDMQKALEASDVTIYAIGTGSLLRQRYEPYMYPGMRMDVMQARGVLETMAEDSGGKVWFPDSPEGFAEAMQGLFGDMESQYRLVFDGWIPPDDKLHKIKLEAFTMNDAGAARYDVRVRKGWRAG
jgi:VWFA-related protein